MTVGRPEFPLDVSLAGESQRRTAAALDAAQPQLLAQDVRPLVGVTCSVPVRMIRASAL
jgi:hypothetical protein